MKIKRLIRIFVAIALIMTLALTVSCGQSDGSDQGGSTGEGSGNAGGSGNSGTGNGGAGSGDQGESGGEKTHKVTVITAEGMKPIEGNPFSVSDGGEVSFFVDLEYGYLIDEVEGADYNVATRTVKLSDITRDARIRLTTKKVNYNTTSLYKFYLDGNVVDKASYYSGASAYAGTTITVKSNYNDATFIGWSFNTSIKDGGELVSKDREYTFLLNSETAKDGVCRVVANYSSVQENVVYYHLNGGSVNESSTNMKNTTYYTATVEGNSVKVTLGINYFDTIGAVACLFWDDGTFYREGYVLKEFNTLPDGSGVGYSSGYKYPIKLEGSDLYCIWAKETPASDFTYKEVVYPLPSGVSASNVPHWVKNGVAITGYNGNDREVVIPEKIGDKYVTAINKSAFQNKKLDTLVLHRRLIEIEDGAFIGCSKLETIYYPDGIYYISNNAFDTVSWGGVKNLYVYASIAPRLGEGWTYSVKFTRFIANPDKKRVALLAGSSGLYGHTAGYLEALLGDEEWCSVNFGMVRSFDTHFIIPLLGQYAKEGDIILFAPENSVRNMGWPDVYWKTLTYLESMLNFFRAVDISYYGNILSTYAEINQGSSVVTGRFTKGQKRYEQIQSVEASYSEWVEYDNANRYSYNDPSTHKIGGSIRFDCMYQYESVIGQKNGTLVDISTTPCVDTLNHAISIVQKNGAKIYYNFAPVSDTAIIKEARDAGPKWFDDFEAFILEHFNFDGVLGDAENYIFNVKYFYDSAYHPNNYGKTYRTYRIYLDLCELLGIEEIKDFYLGGTPDAEGFIRDESGNSLYHATLFEKGSVGGLPVTKATIFTEDQ